MTLLVVLGVVVVATILAALYLSLKSGRGDEPGPGDAGAGDWPARGGSRSGRSRSLAGRVRSRTDHGRGGGSSRRRSGPDDDEDLDVPDYVTARRAARGADGPDRSGLVTAGADQRLAGSRGAAGFDDTDPSIQPGYGTSAGYNGYDAAADTRVSGPPGAGPAGYGTESYSPESYSPESYSTRGYGTESYGTGDYDAGSGRGGYRPGAERGRDGGSSRSRPGYDFGTDPGGTAAGDLGAPAAGGPHGHARPGGRRRAISPGQASSAPGRSAARPDRNGPEDYDDAPTSLTDSSFSSRPGAGSRAAEGDDRAGRRRMAKIQRPNLRVSRSRPDYDNDPWPSADEVDGISDDQFWSELSSDKPLATTARAAHGAADTDRSWTPGDGSGEPGFAAAPVQADSRPAGRGRRARRRGAEDNGPEPRPLPPTGGGQGRRDEPAQSRRGAENDPLTGESYSRHARQASDSRSYEGSRETHRPSHGRPGAATDETQTMPADPRGYGAPAPRGARGAGPGGSLPPAGPPGPGGAGGPYEGGGTSRPDPYRDATRPATPYGEDAGGYQPPARARSRHASPTGNGRPPAPNGPRRARPALPAGGASRESTSGSGSYPAASGSGSYPAASGSGSYPGGAGGSYPGSAGGGSYPRPPGSGSSAGNGSPAYPRGGTDPAYPAANGSPAYPGGNGSGAPNPGPTGSSAYPGRAYPGPDGSPAYPGSNGRPAYPGPSGSSGYTGPSGSPGYPSGSDSSGYPRSTGNDAYRGPEGSPGSRGYPETYGGPAYPDGPAVAGAPGAAGAPGGSGGLRGPGGPQGPGGRPRGRRSSNRDTGRRDGGSYADPYRRPDDGRY